MHRERLKISLQGAVQGVGFRPFVYRLATDLALDGWVSNTSQGVFIEVEGGRASLEQFLARLQNDKPPRAILQSLEASFLESSGYTGFEIRATADEGAKTALILPDIATCADCLNDILDRANRRFGYPFTNCTNCGPRFSIIEGVPYDRPNTSMKKFTMCAECAREYHDPMDRRFHAQPNACPACGPQVQLWDENGVVLCESSEAFSLAAEVVREGKILALKGLGGFQLMVDASNNDAVVRLRQRRHREEKPFALMVPSLEIARQCCRMSESEERLLCSPESPIVLLSARNAGEGGAGLSVRNAQSVLSSSVAPGNPNLGLMLPCTPLHHLLMRELRFPVVATSGNLSDEPICIDEREALLRLAGIADVFLVHDRPIVRHVDDSIARIMCGREMVLRRARGYAPLPIAIRGIGFQPMSYRQDVEATSKTILALGAHLKNTVALKIQNNVFVSQHIGDLETAEAFAAFRRATVDLPRLYDAEIDVVACDMHPEYLSTKVAAEFASKKVLVQHHWAHVAACMTENEVEAPVLGVSWDGTGLGLDGTIWGGEFLLGRADGSFERVAHLRTFRLAGGDQAVKEPRRCCLGILHEIVGDSVWQQPEIASAFSAAELSILRTMLEKNINSPVTSSAGRLFDAVAALMGLRQRSSFEGQAAMELEFAADAGVSDSYPFRLVGASPVVVDWEPTIKGITSDIKNGVSRGAISGKFHNMLAQAIVAVAQKIGQPKVVLTGGCFQNRLLLERVIEGLRQANLRPIWHQRIPPNDGGISFGQAVVAAGRT